MKQLIECVPNFSEGRNKQVIEQLANTIDQVEGVAVLNVDAGWDANRTVITFAGNPHAVVEAAFRGIKVAAELIDMRNQQGEHPRMGATDVCPLVPVQGISMDEVADLARALAQRVGQELNIPVYCYEFACLAEHKRNLAHGRKGEYEGLEKKMADKNWKPDYGPEVYSSAVAQTGLTFIGARRFLVAYNISLQSNSVKLAKEIAGHVRESGFYLRQNKKLVRDKAGNRVRQKGRLKGVKAIGWYMDAYKAAQVSMNLTNIDETPVHRAFFEVKQLASERGCALLSSELIGLIPKRMLLEAAYFALQLTGSTAQLDEKELLNRAVDYLLLNVHDDFDVNKRVLEYVIEGALDE